MRVTLGELKQRLREELAPLDLEMTVYGPFRRGRGDYTAVIAWDWKGFESLHNERASMLLRKFQDAHGEIIALTPEEKDVADRHQSTFALQLDADNDREARFQCKLLQAKLDGMGFEVEWFSVSAGSGHPYR
jgi:hypothetical protein